MACRPGLKRNGGRAASPPSEGAVVPVSPTQPMERWLGFDAIVELPRGRYVALQFKRGPRAYTARPALIWATGRR